MSPTLIALLVAIVPGIVAALVPFVVKAVTARSLASWADRQVRLIEVHEKAGMPGIAEALRDKLRARLLKEANSRIFWESIGFLFRLVTMVTVYVMLATSVWFLVSSFGFLPLIFAGFHMGWMWLGSLVAFVLVLLWTGWKTRDVQEYETGNEIFIVHTEIVRREE